MNEIEVILFDMGGTLRGSMKSTTGWKKESFKCHHPAFGWQF